MYFDEKIAQTMIEREENAEHILTAQTIENIFLSEIEPKDGLEIAELGAGAHPKRYKKLFEFLKTNKGKMQWVDQAPIMLETAKKQIPDEKIIDLVEAEMVSYLEKNKNEFDALILKYSFNYVIPVSLEKWLKTMHESLKNNGIVVATLNLYEEGLKPRSFNASYTINGKPIIQGYKPKHKDIIEIHFLKTGGDKSPNPETFADTKIIYYSPEEIKKAAKEAGFSDVSIFDDWSKNEKWLKRFKKNYPNSEIKSKAILFLKK
jgi:ubiquinone/menaquinone biosynthesis C-methylase UbiE